MAGLCPAAGSPQNELNCILWTYVSAFFCLTDLFSCILWFPKNNNTHQILSGGQDDNDAIFHSVDAFHVIV